VNSHLSPSSAYAPGVRPVGRKLLMKRRRAAESSRRSGIGRFFTLFEQLTNMFHSHAPQESCGDSWRARGTKSLRAVRLRPEARATSEICNASGLPRTRAPSARRGSRETLRRDRTNRDGNGNKGETAAARFVGVVKKADVLALRALRRTGWQAVNTVLTTPSGIFHRWRGHAAGMPVQHVAIA